MSQPVRSEAAGEADSQALRSEVASGSWVIGFVDAYVPLGQLRIIENEIDKSQRAEDAVERRGGARTGGRRCRAARGITVQRCGHGSCVA